MQSSVSSLNFLSFSSISSLNFSFFLFFSLSISLCFTFSHSSISSFYLNNLSFRSIVSKIVSEYDQEIPQSQTADHPVAP